MIAYRCVKSFIVSPSSKTKPSVYFNFHDDFVVCIGALFPTPGEYSRCHTLPLPVLNGLMITYFCMWPQCHSIPWFDTAYNSSWILWFNITVKTSKLCVTGLCAGTSPCDRWIPRTNGQWRGKCFDLMTSSWMLTFVWHFTEDGGGMRAQMLSWQYPIWQVWALVGNALTLLVLVSPGYQQHRYNLLLAIGHTGHHLSDLRTGNVSGVIS